MKTILITIYFIVNPILSSCLILASSDSIYTINSKSNTIYLGIDNYIHIPDMYVSDTIAITTDNGYLFEDSSYFNLMPFKLPVVHILFYDISDNDSTLIRNERFFVKYAPKPTLLIGTKSLSDIISLKKEYILQNPEINIFISDDIAGADQWLKIKRFSLGFVYGSVYKSFESESNNITDEMISEIIKLKPGQEINIKVSLESNYNLTIFLPVYSFVVY